MPRTIGKMRERVTIEAPVPGKNPLGEEVSSWSEVTTVWAEVTPNSGRQYWMAAQAQSEVTHQVRIRWRPGVTTDCRLRHNGALLNIVSVIDFESQGIWLILMCKETR